MAIGLAAAPGAFARRRRAALRAGSVSPVKRALLYLMAALYVVAGVMHFVRPDAYLPLMPPYLPWHAALIFWSGVAEVGLGLAILVPALRPWAAWGIVLLLIAIFPANIHVALYNVPLFGMAEGAGIWNWVRLPVQGVLALWAWWYT